ncbi:hypothetical protein M1D52_09725 [Olivibacter sp. SA151]|uniref:hypothetical protein n=1 Tax=Olivibacter jilunii TaxID=985016 RepID=UPI003F17A2F0
MVSLLAAFYAIVSRAFFPLDKAELFRYNPRVKKSNNLGTFLKYCLFFEKIATFDHRPLSIG